MKGKITIEVDYDTTRVATGDRRYNFVSDVSVNGLSKDISFHAALNFKESIANTVNDAISQMPDYNAPVEVWPVVDTIALLYHFIECQGTVDHFNVIDRYKGDFYYKERIREFFNRITQENFSPEFKELINYDQPKVENISSVIFNQLFFAAWNNGSFYSSRNLSPEGIISGMKTILKNSNIKRTYSVRYLKEIIQDTYKVLDEEIPYFLGFEGKRSFARAIDSNAHIELDGIASRLGVDKNKFQSHVYAYLLAKENEGGLPVE